MDNNQKKISAKRILLLRKLLQKLNMSNKYIQDFNNNEYKNLTIIDEALTHSSANNSFNYEKLEFLGDAVLRLAASEFIERNYPELKVGERSALRAQLVSDQWLQKIGNMLRIEEILVVSHQASKDISAKATLQADATEALIGAIYKSSNNIEAIHDWLGPEWLKQSESVLADPHKKNYKSALQEWSQGQDLNLPHYEIEEKSKKHGNLKRFYCKVFIDKNKIGEGYGGSRKEAEKEAAKFALNHLRTN